MSLLALIAAVVVIQVPDEPNPVRGCLSSKAEGVVVECRQALRDPALSPNRRATLLRVMALRLASRSRWLEAADTYSDLIAATPEDARAHRAYGEVLLLGLGRPEDALAALRESVRLDPDDAEAHGLTAGALNALGRPDDAVRAYEDALRIDPGYLAARPAARKSFDAAQHGLEWPADEPVADREKQQ